MIRSALGLGASGLVALTGTAELANSKVVRGSMGSLFRLPAAEAGVGDFLAWCSERGVEIWVAAADGSPLARSRGERMGRAPVALVVGNEGAGIGAAIEGAASRSDRRAARRRCRVAERRRRRGYPPARGSA